MRREPMQSHIRLGRILGIAVGLHLSWFVIAVLLALSLAGHFRDAQPDWSAALVWSLALVTAVLFFGAVLLHELSHALVARARGLPVGEITLFALGGVSRIEREAESPSTEFWIGIAGPAMSVLLGACCLGLAASLGWQPQAGAATPLQAVLSWLGYINLGLALFNLIPGFPLDGGRVLRAMLWGMTGSRNLGTRWAARVGQLVAFGFIFVGMVQFFGGAGLGGLWLALIGWFLLDAAGAAYGQLRALEELQGLHVSDVMTRECEVVEGRTNLRELVEAQLLRTGRRCFLVAHDGVVTGLVTPREIKEVPREDWDRTTVDQVMRRFERSRTLAPEGDVTEALEVMSREDLQQIPVLAKGRLLGVISRGDILRVLQAHAELG